MSKHRECAECGGPSILTDNSCFWECFRCGSRSYDRPVPRSFTDSDLGVYTPFEDLKASDRQVGGDHYKTLAIQPNEYIFGNNLGWFAGNIVKYATRAGRKGGVAGTLQDIEKIKHYAELWLERIHSEGEPK